MRARTALGIGLGLGLGVAALYAYAAKAPATERVDRCQEGLSLGQIVEAKLGVVGEVSGITSSSYRQPELAVFDVEQEIKFAAHDRETVLGALCEAVQAQLRERCRVAPSISTTFACAGKTSSDLARITDSSGRYSRRPTEGRYHLALETLADGRARVLLTATEWSE